MAGWRARWALAGVLVMLWVSTGWAQVTTTTVQDTVYRADGTAATGSVVVTWNAFTTASGRAVPAGTASATLSPAGVLTMALAPNSGAIPIGSYYTAVFHLNDGSTSREFWVIPVMAAGSVPVKLAAIRNSVLPLSVAMQTVSKSYVDSAIAAAVTGHPQDSSPYVEKGGDTMTGPLILSGDPVSANQAANKNYVDVNVGAAAAGLGRKVDELPGATQVVAQPSGTDLEVNNLNGSLYASQYASGGGNNGISNAIASADCVNGCDVIAEHTYNSAEQLSQAIPSKGRLTDKRGGEEAVTTTNPLNPTTNGLSAAEALNLINTRSAPELKAAVPGASAADAVALRIRSSGLTGGSNQFPQDVELPPYFKSTYAGLDVGGTYNTQGQHVLDIKSTNCYGVGDCLIGSQVILSSGGSRDEADEGAHPFDIQISEDPAVFTGTCSGGCTTGATTLSVATTGGGGTQGDGRFLIDTNPAKLLSNGVLTGGHTAVPFAVADFSGTSFATSTFLTATSAATSQPTNLAPGTVTLAIATSGVPAGYATNTAALPASSGVACVADPHALGVVGFANFEQANYTVVDGTHVRLTLNKVHAAGTTIAVGGLCGYGLEQKVDTTQGLRQVFPVVGSPTATELYYTDAATTVVGINQTTSAYLNFSSAIASIARTGNVVTVTTASFIPVDASGLTFTISGVTDPSYNGNFVVTSTGNFTFTYASAGANSTSSGGTAGIVTGGFALYPMAEVLSVWNPATKAVDGYMALAPNTVAWAAGDAVEEPHYFQQDVNGDQSFITQYLPRPTQFNRSGIQYQGNVGPGIHGWSVVNAAPLGSYLGNGGSHTLPDTAYESTGYWKNILVTQAGDDALFRVFCNSHGCNKWNSGYNVFQLNNGTGGADVLSYQPQNSSATWILGGVPYQFSPTAFTAGTINVGTLNATTINGGVSASAISSGTISAARLPVFGPSGSTHSAGIVPDPGATAGNTRYLREDGTFAVPPGGGGGATTSENVVAYTATPVFSATASANVLTLTGDVTSSTLPAGTAGQKICLVFVQDTTGAHAVVGPANVAGFFTVGAQGGKRSQQCYTYSASLSLWLAQSAGLINF